MLPWQQLILCSCGTHRQTRLGAVQATFSTDNHMWNVPNPMGVLKTMLYVYFWQHHVSGRADSAFLSFLFTYNLFLLALTMALNVVIKNL